MQSDFRCIKRFPPSESEHCFFPAPNTPTPQVTILDLNDNAPQFNQTSYLFSTRENQPISRVIGQVQADDADSQLYGHVTYGLGKDRDALRFRIDPESGLIRSSQSLDREQQARYVFRVLARDASSTSLSSNRPEMSHTRESLAGQRTGTATVTVLVEDVNDNWPVFISPNSTANTLAIAIDETLGHKLAYIHAEDADEGENALITYRIKAGNHQKYFGLDPTTGLLFLAGTPGTPISSVNRTNFGSLLTKLHQSSFHALTLEACDHGFDPKPKCTLFPNLKIHMNNVKDRSQQTKLTGTHLPVSENNDKILGISGKDLERYDPTNPVAHNIGFKGTWNRSSSHYNVNEVVIICLAVIFTVVLLTTLFLICIVRRRSLATFRLKKSCGKGIRCLYVVAYLLVFDCIASNNGADSMVIVDI